MTIEFSRYGRIYQTTVDAPLQPPPPTITIPFRKCVLRPMVMLELAWVKTDDIRGVELYTPVMEVSA